MMDDADIVEMFKIVREERKNTLVEVVKFAKDKGWEAFADEIMVEFNVDDEDIDND